RAARDLVLGDLHEPVVVGGQEQLLGLARALTIHALADHRGARLLHERGCRDHRRKVGGTRHWTWLDLATSGWAIDQFGDCPDVVGGRPAATAHHAHAVALH